MREPVKFVALHRQEYRCDRGEKERHAARAELKKLYTPDTVNKRRRRYREKHIRCLNDKLAPVRRHSVETRTLKYRNEIARKGAHSCCLIQRKHDNGQKKRNDIATLKERAAFTFDE